MTRKILFVADLGHLKAYQLEEDQPLLSKPRVKLWHEYETNIPNHLGEELSDQAGRYRKGSMPGGASHLSDGEAHNIDLERRRRAIKLIAKRIQDLIAHADGAEACYLAAPGEINKPVIEALDGRSRKMIQKVVSANLTRLTPEEVISHFPE